jgi:hypothetical protein
VYRRKNRTTSKAHHTDAMTFSFQTVFMPCRSNQPTNSVAPEPEGSSPRSQEPATSSYPEPTESTPPPPNLPKIHSDLILPYTPRSSEWTVFIRAFSQKSCICMSALPYVPMILINNYNKKRSSIKCACAFFSCKLPAPSSC